MRRPRVLLAILVYNGRAFVPACIRSAAGLRAGRLQVDVLVLDDCSPDRELSEGLASLCDSLGVEYYRSPRNLGIPRNMNLALLRATSADYDYVVILNSDTVLPLNLVEGMVRVAQGNEAVGSVTAWSNNASAFSMPNAEATFLAEQDMIDWASSVLWREFGATGLEIPTGVGFCLLIPVGAVNRVGLFDPIFGRGYCEEVDWCQRSRRAGLRALLAPGVLVFHMGSGSTRETGMLAPGHTTVQDHERIINLRYPSYRDDVERFLGSDPIGPVHERASRAMVLAGARRWGYSIEATNLGRSSGAGVPFFVDPSAQDLVLTGTFGGFRMEVPAGDEGVEATMAQLVGRPPRQVVVYDRGGNTDRLAAAHWSGPVDFIDRAAYPELVGPRLPSASSAGNG